MAPPQARNDCWVADDSAPLAWQEFAACRMHVQTDRCRPLTMGGIDLHAGMDCTPGQMGNARLSVVCANAPPRRMRPQDYDPTFGSCYRVGRCVLQELAMFAERSTARAIRPACDGAPFFLSPRTRRFKTRNGRASHDLSLPVQLYRLCRKHKQGRSRVDRLHAA